ncbi:hypothetical protein E1H12_20145 [Geitlerinema sp. P-1104]|uniref:Ig-like domain-containing protein n=1 Tax=Geitlerinema sp. P-1104 TaxID=2546230 RepID=UPI001476B78F|nr:Ig-like domain-containing protein [Geitlerinema sp. P-1104]NMG60758.1 hypothetical protein [Geitlerinema sp. P-1104]
MTSQVPSNDNASLFGVMRSRLILIFLVCTVALTGYTLALQHGCDPIIWWQPDQQLGRHKCGSNPIVIQPSSVNVEVNSKKQVKAIVEGQESSNTRMSWKSQNPQIAQVDNNGIVTGIKKGKTQIEAHSINDTTQKDVAEVNVTGGVIDVVEPPKCSPQAAVAVGTVVTIAITALLVPPPIAFLAGSAAATGLCWLVDKVN